MAKQERLGLSKTNKGVPSLLDDLRKDPNRDTSRELRDDLRLMLTILSEGKTDTDLLTDTLGLKPQDLIEDDLLS